MEKSADEGSLITAQDDYDAIVRSVKDYAEGWYNGDPNRMSRCLHADLLKRTIAPGPSPGTWQLRRPITYEGMVRQTREGGGSEIPESERRYQIDVLDVFRHVATARCVSPEYVDFLHLAKFAEGLWLIVDALWELRTGAMEPSK